MKICVDTTILKDILKDEYRSFHEALYSALRDRETLVIPTVVFAELMPQFNGDTKQLSLFFKEHKIEIEDLGIDSATAAGLRWIPYLKRKTKT